MAGWILLALWMSGNSSLPIVELPSAERNTPHRVVVRGWIAGGDEALVTAVVEEMAAIWKPNGVEVATGADDRPAGSDTAIALIFVGTEPAATPRPLAWVGFLRNGLPLPVIYVSVSSTQALVLNASFYGTPVGELPHVLRQRLLARALGREAAHELGHYLLALRQHAATGLMRSHFSPEELIADEHGPFRLNSAERAALATHLREARFLSEPAAELSSH